MPIARIVSFGLTTRNMKIGRLLFLFVNRRHGGVFGVVMTFMIIIYLISFVLNITVCSIIISAMYKRSASTNDNNHVSQGVRNSHLNNQVTRMLIGNCAIFFICQTPVRTFILYGLLRFFNMITSYPDPNVLQAVLWISEILLYIKCVYKPDNL